MKILIVDDAAIMREMLKDIIELAGCEVIGEAVDGEEGLEKYKELKPDLTLLDITMPKMDGLECLKAIKEYDEAARVYICSAVGQESVIMKAGELGAIGYLVKPFEDEKIIKKLKKFAEKKK